MSLPSFQNAFIGHTDRFFHGEWQPLWVDTTQECVDELPDGRQQDVWISMTATTLFSKEDELRASCDSGDSLDSFVIGARTRQLSDSLYSLPPTPPATPPNYSLEIKPLEQKCSKFFCDLCAKAFEDRAHLEEHRRFRHSDDRPHACPSCSKSFKSKSNLRQHIKSSHEKVRFSCHLCDRGNFSESGYRYHLRSVHQDPTQKVYPCSQCDKSFIQQKLLTKHVMTKHSEGNERRFSCTFCSATFKRKDHVTRHVTDTHSLVAKLFECDACDAKFQSATRLRQHQRLHEDRGGFYECQICHERLVRKKSYRRHVAAHQQKLKFIL